MKEAEMQIIVNNSQGHLLNDYIYNPEDEKAKIKSNKKKIILAIVIPLVIVLISLIGVFLFFWFKSKEPEKDETNENELEYKPEELVVKINYTPNMIYRYSLKKSVQMTIEGIISEDNSPKETEQYSEFILLIKEEKIEKNKVELKKKKWFTGYLAILNISLNYENNNTQIIYEDNYYGILNGEKEELNNMGNLTFVKVDFYENGEIKNYYIPSSNFSILNMQYIKEYSNLIFPKISSYLYSANIEQSLNELLQKENNGTNIRELKEKTHAKHETKNKKKKYRILSDNIVDDSNEFEMEEYLTPSTEEHKYYDLREKSNNSNITNLTEFSMENIANEEVNLENSELNKTIYTSINKDGFLESVTNLEKVIILNQENKEQEEYIDDIINNNTSNIDFGIKSMSFEINNELDFKGNLTNKSIVTSLLNIFENTTYELFNDTYYNEYISLFVKEKIIKENNSSNESRFLESNEEIKEYNIRRTSSESDMYYGINKLVNEKDLYSYNFLGLKMQKKIINELDPSTGKSLTYFNLMFGNINHKIKTSEQSSNLHIILEKKNKMAFNLIQLLYKTNSDLKQRNKNISQIVIEFENNILTSMNDYDYSNIFNEYLEQVNNQLNTFASDLFNQLIILINNLYVNYTNILEEVKNDKYDIFKNIMKVTKDEYMNYIYQMNDNLENFTNATLIFLELLEDEINNIDKIEKIDFLYDILDNIYESKLLVSQFNNNLFKSIQKGILTFKTDINEFKEMIIGDLLYITDFLAVNILKNEIIMRVYAEETLKDLSIKLKNFRDIIQIILDQLINDINKDYEFEMSNKNGSLKLFSERKAENHYNQIDEKSNNLVSKIKQKINYNNIYEIYTSNLDYINYINNKTIIEFINDVNNNYVEQINNIHPEFIDINERKIQKDEINVNKSTDNDIIKNKDNIINDLHNSFINHEMNFLFQELTKILNDSIEIYKENIDYNYQLGMDYVDELNNLIYENYNGNSYIGEGFYQKYQAFLNIYNESKIIYNFEELFSKYELCYIKVKNETYNFLNTKLFHSELKEKLNLNISIISEQIKIYFNIDKLNSFKNELIRKNKNELKKYIEMKNNTLVEKFDYVYNNSKGLFNTNSDYYISSTVNGLLKTTNNIEKVNLDTNYIFENNNNITEIKFMNFQNNILEYFSEYYLSFISIAYNESLGYNDIFSQKEILFDISKSITKEINDEIDNINNYIRDYTTKYKEENFYNMHYYLYKINNLLFDDEISFLYNELRTAFNYTIQMHKKRIDENYKLANDYTDQLRLYIYEYHAGDHLDLGRGAYQKYIRFVSLFEEYVALANSDTVYNNLKHNYDKIRDKIFNFVKNKMSNITEYYFGNNIYKDNFNFISRINNELFKISERINTYFNEGRFEFLKAEFFTYSLNELRNYNGVYNKTFVEKFEAIRAHTDGIYDTNADFRYWYKTWTGHVKNRPNCYIPLTNNIDQVDITISHTIQYMDNKTDIIIKNLNDRINEYLSKYINTIQTLYNDLNIHIEEKINNNNNILELFFDYERELNNILIFNSNYGAFTNLKNNTKIKEIFYINNLEKNLDLLTNDFLNNYYLESYDTFLEYPNEILYKIKQFKIEIKDNINIIKQKVFNMNMKIIINIINETNIFIENLIKSHQKYILININNSIMEEYLTSKNNLISNHYNNIIKNMSKIQNLTLNLITDANFIFQEQKDDLILSKIFEKLDLFIIDLEKKINNSFIYEKCYESSLNDTELIDIDDINNFTDDINNFTDDINNCTYLNSNNNNNNILICEKMKYKSNLSDYEYNYQIVKLRSGIFYTKTALENIMNLFDDVNYDDLLNIKQYNNIEHVINEKNILDIYNSSNNKLKEINENSKALLKEQNEYFYKYILSIYSLNNDYYPFLKKLETIIKSESESYNDYYINYFQSKFNVIESLLLDFNNTLFEQKNECRLYLIDENNQFDNMYNDYLEQFKKVFEICKQEILKLNKSSYFFNSFRNFLSREQNKKRTYFKNVINNISKEYNFELLNITLNVGEIIELFLIKEYEELEFSFSNENMKIFDLYFNSFLNRIIVHISEIEKSNLNRFRVIYYEFLDKFNSNVIDKNLYNIIQENYTKCLNYSIDLINQTLIEDEINYENHSGILNNLDLNDTENKELRFINQTEVLLDCINNNYYNFSIKNYKNFDNKYEMKLNNTINEINKIDINDIPDILSYQYFEKFFYLDNYNKEKEVLDNIYYQLFLAYDDILLYINYTQNTMYFEHLNGLLIESFKPSYIPYINNYLIPQFINNISVYINNKAEIFLYYIINKIKDEYDYYIKMLNNTEEIGKNSKESFLNLYDDVNKKLEQYIYYPINDYVLFFINIFYKNNKYIFKDNYIKYYINGVNEYNIEIHQLKDYLSEIIYDGKFNKTLNEYSNELFEQLIFKKLNDTINIFIYDNLYQFYSYIEELKIKMNNILSNIETNEENIIINNMINNYNIILKNQNNQFIFKVSQIPMEYLNSFIKNVLEPPLLEIKLQYNIIENKILEKVLNITNNFPDFSIIIKEKLAIYDILELIKLTIEYLQNSLLKYQNDLNNDYDSYINKLIHYTYINGLNTYDEPCNYSFCSINISQMKKQMNISDNNKIQKGENIPLNNAKSEKKNYRNIHFKDYSNIGTNSNTAYIKKLLEENIKYDETLGAISRDDIIPFLLDIRNTIFELNKTYINNFDINGKMKTNIYISKINITYKVKLKNTILKSASKFSHILSRESYEELVNNMLKQYYIIENYLNNITFYLEKDINNLIDILNNTSIFLALVNDLTYDKLLGYFDILYELISNKYELFVGNKNKYIRNLNKKDEDDDNDDDIEAPNEIDFENMRYFEEQFNIIKNENKNAFSGFIVIADDLQKEVEGLLIDIFKDPRENSFEINIDFEIETSIVFSKGKLRKLGFKDGTTIKLLNLEINFIFFLPIFPYLQIRVIPLLNLDLTFDMGFELDTTKDEFSVFYEPSGNAEVSVSLEMGFYIPAFSPGMEISLSIGIKGVLGSGSVGMKISFYFDKPKLELEFYIKYNAFSFTFYSLFKIRIKLGIIKFSFQFYLIYKELFGGIHGKISKKTELSLKKIKDLASKILF